MLYLLLCVFCMRRHTYIITFKKPEFDENVGATYATNLKTNISYFSSNDVFKQTILNGVGYIAELENETVHKIESDPNTLSIERDEVISLQNYTSKEFKDISLLKLEEEIIIQEKEIKRILTQKNAPWGLKKISDPNEKDYLYPLSSGEGVTIYVIDTGIDVKHEEFGGRAVFGINLVKNSKDLDENGHGTHVSGIIGGKIVGIAKKAKLVAVKVLDKEGIGMISRLILGVDYVIRNHAQKLEDYKLKSSLKNEKFNEKSLLKTLQEGLKNSERPKSVVNMSVGGLKSKALELAIEYASNLGIHFSAAAGNDHDNACEYSPGSSQNVITVGASTKKNNMAFFSNYGVCVDIFAPGVDIASSWIENTYRFSSGTSMAAPHVTGVMALYLGEEFYEPGELFGKIMDDSENIITNTNKHPIISMLEEEMIHKKSNMYPMVSIKKLLDSLKD